MALPSCSSSTAHVLSASKQAASSSPPLTRFTPCPRYSTTRLRGVRGAHDGSRVCESRRCVRACPPHKKTRRGALRLSRARVHLQAGADSDFEHGLEGGAARAAALEDAGQALRVAGRVPHVSTLKEALDEAVRVEAGDALAPLRMPVSGVYTLSQKSLARKTIHIFCTLSRKKMLFREYRIQSCLRTFLTDLSR